MKREVAMAKQLEITKQDAVDLYDSDFFEWTQRSAELIRQGRFSEADLEHIAEEIEDMGKRDRREVRSRLTVLIAHRLKWNYQPEQRSPSWRATIMEQRRQIVLVLDDSPSLRRAAVEELASIYAKAVKEAREDTGLAPNAFPKTCPYSLTDLLESRIVPE
jgi:hypothetical protein